MSKFWTCFCLFSTFIIILLLKWNWHKNLIILTYTTSNIWYIQNVQLSPLFSSKTFASPQKKILYSLGSCSSFFPPLDNQSVFCLFIYLFLICHTNGTMYVACYEWFISLSIIFRFVYDVSGEGNGTPLQYSCLENPMDRGAW